MKKQIKEETLRLERIVIIIDHNNYTSIIVK